MKVTSTVPSTKESDTSSIDTLRGGSSSSGSGSSDDPNYQNAVYTHPQQQQQQQQNSNDDDKKTSTVDEDEQLFHETVQDRVDRWRQEQMSYQPYGGGGGGGATTTAMQYEQQQTPYYQQQQQQQTGGFNNNDNSIVNVNPQHQQQFPTSTGSNNSPAQQGAVDANRLKLILSVSKGSRAVTFFVLMWRNIYMFDVADTSIKKSMGFYRGFVRSILTLLLCGNIAGFVSSMLPSSSTTSTSSTDHHHHHSTKTKKRMKAILNLDKLVEIVLLVWYFFRLTIFPSKYVPKEVFIAGALHSTFFLLQCQATTRFVWDEGIQLSPKAGQQQQQQQQQQQRDIFFDDDDDDMDDYQRYASYGGSQSASPYTTQSPQ
eukprot:CAMPEP_0113502458 /NCGR_PEP_ID=MMETSP0014_2-20120614/33568_1 /TAXON_ID=2857 /ORGANISM="Nitzschia sp." /LENGTH=371 /DNA_ID=CAMNT_0000397253 /DNA_START=161 /DNA_END=1276 /DNA_ORIENTATION=+ /assembly_acc=CAM_ASM_000159